MSAEEKMNKTCCVREALDILLRHLEHTANEMLWDTDQYKGILAYGDCIPDNVIRKFMDWWLEEVNRQSNKTFVEFSCKIRTCSGEMFLRIHNLNPDPEWPSSKDFSEEVFTDVLLGSEDDSESSDSE